MRWIALAVFTVAGCDGESTIVKEAKEQAALRDAKDRVAKAAGEEVRALAAKELDLSQEATLKLGIHVGGSKNSVVVVRRDALAILYERADGQWKRTWAGTGTPPGLPFGMAVELGELGGGEARK